MTTKSDEVGRPATPLAKANLDVPKGAAAPRNRPRQLAKCGRR
jgi:hypothetical protein